MTDSYWVTTLGLAPRKPNKEEPQHPLVGRTFTLRAALSSSQGIYLRKGLRVEVTFVSRKGSILVRSSQGFFASVAVEDLAAV